MAEAQYAADQDGPVRAISPMEELAGLRARHERLMKEHSQLRYLLVALLRQSIARLESENADMSGLIGYLRDLHPATDSVPADPTDTTALEREKRQLQLEVDRLRHEAGRRY